MTMVNMKSKALGLRLEYKWDVHHKKKAKRYKNDQDRF